MYINPMDKKLKIRNARTPNYLLIIIIVYYNIIT